jgi:PAS domain S-box-containing protein
LSPDGQRRWLNVTATPLSLDDLGAVILYEDITERKQIQAARQVEQALRESERRFRIMANELPLMIWVHDADLSAAFVNQTCCDYFGKPQEGFIGDGWREALHPDDRERYLDAFLRSTRERQPFHDECRMRRADGQWRWLESFARPIWDADGTFAGIVGSSLDITERKLADDALRDSHRELKRRAEQLGRLTSELTLAEQRERERLAKVLHDHLQQLLVGATFGIDRLGAPARLVDPDTRRATGAGQRQEPTRTGDCRGTHAGCRSEPADPARWRAERRAGMAGAHHARHARADTGAEPGGRCLADSRRCARRGVRVRA